MASPLLKNCNRSIDHFDVISVRFTGYVVAVIQGLFFTFSQLSVWRSHGWKHPTSVRSSGDGIKILAQSTIQILQPPIWESKKHVVRVWIRIDSAKIFSQDCMGKTDQYKSVMFNIGFWSWLLVGTKTISTLNAAAALSWTHVLHWEEMEKMWQAHWRGHGENKHWAWHHHHKYCN